MSESILSQTPPLLNPGSPPPKCAICLGVCNNKCFSDSCLHEFCFSCLMQWSKIKAECPLCKKPFKSILHNVKSNEDYEEYIVPSNSPPVPPFDMDDTNFLFMPQLPPRHFQFRTTFTVDPGGELAIQQMLLSHPLTSHFNLPIHPRYRSRSGHSRIRGASSATSFRRLIYDLNYWVSAPPDVTGRYRDITPEFYQLNPTSRHRLVPWLNRELNALLRENTQQVMNLVDIIMEHLPQSHIRGRAFRALLLPYLGNSTDHFLHEFYHFMRSPYDMIGYDRHISYSEIQPTTYTFTVSDYDEEEEDSDVTIVHVSEPTASRTAAPVIVDNNPFRQPTLEVIEINSSDSGNESDVIIREPPVEVVDLVETDSDDNNAHDIDYVVPTTPYERVHSDNSDHSKQHVPIKIKLKNLQFLRDKSVHKKKKSSRRYSSCSSCTSSDSSDSSSSSSAHHRSRKWRKHKRSKNKSYKDFKRTKDKYRSHYKRKKIDNRPVSRSSSSSNSSCQTKICKQRKRFAFDSDDNLPLSKIRKKEIQKRSVSHTVTSSTSKTPWILSPTREEQPLSRSPLLWTPESTQCDDDYNSYRMPVKPFYPNELPKTGDLSVATRHSYAAPHPRISDYTSPGTSGYQQPSVSYTPPIDSRYGCYPPDYHYQNLLNRNRDSNHSQLFVNIGVGTSPLKKNDAERRSGVPNSSDKTTVCVQSLVLKKKHNPLPTLNHLPCEDDSSDSNN